MCKIRTAYVHFGCVKFVQPMRSIVKKDLKTTVEFHRRIVGLLFALLVLASVRLWFKVYL
jgi:hypothetical protein